MAGKDTLGSRDYCKAGGMGFNALASGLSQMLVTNERQRCQLGSMCWVLSFHKYWWQQGKQDRWCWVQVQCVGFWAFVNASDGAANDMGVHLCSRCGGWIRHIGTWVGFDTLGSGHL